jgi:hypothetical protein
MAKLRDELDGVSDDSYECPRCKYNGRMLFYKELEQTELLVVGIGPWRVSGGRMVCPECGRAHRYGKWKYGQQQMSPPSAELIDALSKRTAVNTLLADFGGMKKSKPWV